MSSDKISTTSTNQLLTLTLDNSKTKWDLSKKTTTSFFYFIQMSVFLCKTKALLFYLSFYNQSKMLSLCNVMTTMLYFLFCLMSNGRAVRKLNFFHL